MESEVGGARPLIVVGGTAVTLNVLAKLLPDRSVVIVDHPDGIRKRNVRETTAGAAVLHTLIEWDYQPADAADCLYHRYRDLRPVAVVPMVEYGVPFAARLAERYGVPGAGYGAARLLRDKRLQRVVTAAAGIANPRSVEVAGPDQVRAVLAELGGPAVLKPANRQASAGTRILHDPADVDAAWAECMDQDEGVFTPDSPPPVRMLVEQFVRGDEYSVELMIRGGRRVFGAVTRKFIFDGPRPVEQGHLHPADIGEELTGRLLAETERVLAAVGMNTGFVHCEWIMMDGVPYFVECAARMAGDWIPDLINIAWRYDVVEQYYAMMRGEPVAEQPAEAHRHAAIWMSAPPAAGEVESVGGAEQAEGGPGVHRVIVIGVGERTYPMRCSWHRVSGVIAEGATGAEALANAQQANGRIEVKVRPLPEPAPPSA